MAARARGSGTGRATPRPRTHPRTRPRPRHRTSEMAEPKLLTVPRSPPSFRSQRRRSATGSTTAPSPRCASAGRSGSSAKTSKHYSNAPAPTAPRSPRAATSGNQQPRPCHTATTADQPRSIWTPPPTSVGSQEVGVADCSMPSGVLAPAEVDRSRDLKLNRDRKLAGHCRPARHTRPRPRAGPFRSRHG